MPKLFRPKKLIISLLSLCLVIISLIATGKTPEELLQLAVPQSQQSVQGIQTQKQYANVVKAVDGDTITVSLNGTQEKVRIIGINTPESVDPRRGVQCFGKEAARFTEETLQGQTVTLETDPSQSDRDKYGRMLRYVWIGDIDFGKLLISSGFAHEYTYGDPHKYQKEYQEAENEARINKKGLWADEVCAQESS